MILSEEKVVRADPAFCRGRLVLGPVCELETGTSLRAVPCRAPRALTVATHWSGPDLEDLLESPGLQSLETSQQLDYTATDIKIRASTSLSLSVQVSKNGPGKISCLSLGGGRRSN